MNARDTPAQVAALRHLRLLLRLPRVAVRGSAPELCLDTWSLSMDQEYELDRRDRLQASHSRLHLRNLVSGAQLRELADRDPLTGTYNRRYFDVTIARELSYCRRHGTSLALILIDIDHFKSVNDTYGHRAGDQLLISLADLLKRNSRGSDIICRFGGEEFLIALPDTDCATAAARAEEYARGFSDAGARWQGQQISATLSAGVASFPEQAEDADKLLRCADIALYQAKKSGRNRVVAYSGEMRLQIPATD